MSELTEHEQQFANIYLAIKELNKRFAAAIPEGTDEELQELADKQAELMEQLLAEKFQQEHLKFTQDLREMLEECKAISAELEKLN